MSEFEYYIVLKSIIYALMVARILDGWNNILWNYKTIKISRSYLILSLGLFLLIILKFYVGFSNNLLHEVDSPLFLLYEILTIISLYFFVYQSILTDAKDIDLKAFMREHRNKMLLTFWFFLFVQTLINIKQFGLNYYEIVPNLAGLILCPIVGYMKKMWLVEALFILFTTTVFIKIILY